MKKRTRSTRPSPASQRNSGRDIWTLCGIILLSHPSVSHNNPLEITGDVIDALHAVEDAAAGEIDQVCYKDA